MGLYLPACQTLSSNVGQSYMPLNNTCFKKRLAPAQELKQGLAKLEIILAKTLLPQGGQTGGKHKDLLFTLLN